MFVLLFFKNKYSNKILFKLIFILSFLSTKNRTKRYVIMQLNTKLKLDV